jgi:hypothetical protein
VAGEGALEGKALGKTTLTVTCHVRRVICLGSTLTHLPRRKGLNRQYPPIDQALAASVFAVMTRSRPSAETSKTA